MKLTITVGFFIPEESGNVISRLAVFLTTLDNDYIRIAELVIRQAFFIAENYCI
ncbi:hypothetical protein [Ruminococcus sp.]|uniref:hypothetical protein n=1 Tax=Ruminococcus sp. TaxID=41978 RepID=UPI002E81DF9E|nr:hypothetical protein [Ruminococcus sp.]MEE3492757.1 hypothetical protein [Ruminococcus sp.]